LNSLYIAAGTSNPVSLIYAFHSIITDANTNVLEVPDIVTFCHHSIG